MPKTTGTYYRHGYGKARPYRKTRGWFGPARRPRSYTSGPSLQQELKFKDTVSTDAVVVFTGAIQIGPNLVAQGTGEEERVGRKIIIRSISCRFQCVLPADPDAPNITGGDTLRIIIYIDKQANGAAATVLDILETATYDSYRNLSNTNRFIILKDKWVTMNRPNSVLDGQAPETSTSPIFVREWKWYKKLNLPIEFDGTSGVLTEIQSNNISYLYITAFGIAGVNLQCTRIRFDG